MSENVNEILGAAGAEGAQVKAVDYLFHASAEDFKKIKSAPISYWLTQNVYEVFNNSDQIKDAFPVKSGIMTGNDDRFIRFWSEVDVKKIGFGLEDSNEMKSYWYPLSKGGDFRKWYGNNLHVIDLWKDGLHIKNSGGNFRLRDPKWYFKPYITWSRISSSSIAFRMQEKGMLFADAAPGIFSDRDSFAIIALLNSKLANYFLEAINPTLNYQTNDIERIPSASSNYETGEKLYYLAKSDWNTFETSWDFTSNPLIQLHTQNPSQTLAENYQAWWDSNQTTIAEMQRLEEENNCLFIEAYGLQDELTPDVPLEEISLTVNPKYRYGGNASDAELAARFQSDTVCELISYAIGCMMGRYSLDRAGLVYAHAGNAGFADLVNEGAYRSFAADEDGIIPLTDQEWFADDATHRLVQFVKTVWGEASLSANLAFMAQSLSLHALKPKASESSLDVLRRYLSSQFFKDHCRTYKKRPIYWLFSSGKQKAFECLVYLHRYNESTLARMRTEYVVPLIGKLHSEAENLQRLAENAESTAQANKAKKALADLAKKQQELSAFDDSLKHFADQRITLDLDDGVKVNYAKFGELLADVKAITGK